MISWYGITTTNTTNTTTLLIPYEMKKDSSYTLQLPVGITSSHDNLNVANYKLSL